MPPTDKSELIELFLTNNLGTKQESFETKFNTLLGRTTFLGSTTKPAYWLGFFHGSLVTLSGSGLMKKLQLEKAGYRLSKEGVIFYAVTKKKKIIVREVKISEDKIASVDLDVSESTIGEIQKRVSITSESARKYSLDAQSLTLLLNTEAKKLNGDKRCLLSEKQLSNALREATTDHTWHEIPTEENHSLYQAAELLTSEDKEDVEQGAKEFIVDLTELYQETPHEYAKKIENGVPVQAELECASHGFVHGALALNFKYRLDLDIFTEYYAGSGRIDLLVASTNPDNPIPIVVEFKAGDGAQAALNQIEEAGYVGPHLNLRARGPEQAIMVGVDVTRETGEQIQIKQSEDIYYPKGVLPAILAAAHTYNSGGAAPDTADIQQELMSLYHRYGKETHNKFRRYLGHLIGNAMSSSDVKLKYVSSSCCDENITDKPVRFLFQQGQETPILLQMTFMSEGPAKGTRSKKKQAPNTNWVAASIPQALSEAQRFIQVDITTDKEGKPLDDVKFTSIQRNQVRFQRDTSFEEIPDVEADALFNQDSTDRFLKNSPQLKKFIRHEMDLQVVIAGMLTDGTRVVLTESNASSGGRADIISIREGKVSIIELKMEGNPDEPIKQAVRYAAQIKFLTGKGIERSEDFVTLRGFTFQTTTGQLKKRHESSPVRVVHTSDSELPSSQDTVDAPRSPDAEAAPQTPIRNTEEAGSLQRIPLSPRKALNQSPIAGSSGRQDQGTPGDRGYQAVSDTAGTENESPDRRGEKRKSDTENLSGIEPLEKIRASAQVCTKSPRTKRAAESDCASLWEEIEAIRAPQEAEEPVDTIHIDSDKFMSRFHSDQRSPEQNEQLIALAHAIGEPKIVGTQKKRVQQLIQDQEVRLHLDSGTIAERADQLNWGMNMMDIGVALAKGDLDAAAQNINLIVLYEIGGKAAKTLAISGAGLVEQGELLAGIGLSTGGALLVPALTTLLTAPDLYERVQACLHQTCDEQTWVQISLDASLLGTQVGTAGLSFVSTLMGLSRVAALSGTAGNIISVGIIVGTRIYLAVKQVEEIEKILKLSRSEKFTEGLRGFIGLPVSEQISELEGKKQGNNQLVQQALSFLKTQVYFRAYILPTGKLIDTNCRESTYTVKKDAPYYQPDGASMIVGSASITKKKTVCNKVLQVDQDNTVKLDTRILSYPDRSAPDVPEEGTVFCRPRSVYPPPGGDRPTKEMPICDNAIGVSYGENGEENCVYVDLKEGNDQFYGATGESYTMLVGNGDKKYYGRDGDDRFILLGSHTTGTLDGGGGCNLLDLTHFASTEHGRIVIHATASTHWELSEALYIFNMQRVLGRLRLPDTISVDCGAQYVDSQGGSGDTSRDILLLDKQHCSTMPGSYQMVFRIHAYTSLLNNALTGHFFYDIQSGPFNVNIDKESQAQHDFRFNFALNELTTLETEAFGARSERQNMVLEFRGTTGGLTGKIAHVPNTFYHLKERVRIQVRQQGLHIDVPHHDGILNQRILKERYFPVLQRLGVDTSMTIHWIDSETHQIRKIVFIGAKHLENLYSYVPFNKRHHPHPLEFEIYVRNRVQMSTLDLRALKKVLPKHWLPLNPKVRAQDTNLHIHLVAPDNTVVAKVYFKTDDFQPTYERFRLILTHVPLSLQRNQEHRWQLKPIAPYTFPTGKKILSITEEEVEKEQVIVLSEEMGHYCFRKRDTHFTIDTSSESDSPHSVILNGFFHSTRLKTLHFQFKDQTISASSAGQKAHQTQQNIACKTSSASLPRDTANHHTRTDLHIEAPNVLELVGPPVDEVIEGNDAPMEEVILESTPPHKHRHHHGEDHHIRERRAVNNHYANLAASQGDDGKAEVSGGNHLSLSSVVGGAACGIVGYAMTGPIGGIMASLACGMIQSIAGQVEAKPNTLNQDNLSVEDAYDEEVETTTKQAAYYVDHCHFSNIVDQTVIVCVQNREQTLPLPIWFRDGQLPRLRLPSSKRVKFPVQQLEANSPLIQVTDSTIGETYQIDLRDSKVCQYDASDRWKCEIPQRTQITVIICPQQTKRCDTYTQGVLKSTHIEVYSQYHNNQQQVLLSGINGNQTLMLNPEQKVSLDILFGLFPSDDHSPLIQMIRERRRVERICEQSCHYARAIIFKHSVVDFAISQWLLHTPVTDWINQKTGFSIRWTQYTKCAHRSTELLLGVPIPMILPALISKEKYPDIWIIAEFIGNASLGQYGWVPFSIAMMQESPFLVNQKARVLLSVLRNVVVMILSTEWDHSWSLTEILIRFSLPIAATIIGPYLPQCLEHCGIPVTSLLQRTFNYCTILSIVSSDPERVKESKAVLKAVNQRVERAHIYWSAFSVFATKATSCIKNIWNQIYGDGSAKHSSSF